MKEVELQVENGAEIGFGLVDVAFEKIKKKPSTLFVSKSELQEETDRELLAIRSNGRFVFSEIGDDFESEKDYFVCYFENEVKQVKTVKGLQLKMALGKIFAFSLQG